MCPQVNVPMLIVCCQLMRKNPDKRLGSGANDSDEVMRQGFFRVRQCLSL